MNITSINYVTISPIYLDVGGIIIEDHVDIRIAADAIIEPSVLIGIKEVVPISALQATKGLEKLDTKLNASLNIDMNKKLDTKLNTEPNTVIPL